MLCGSHDGTFFLLENLNAGNLVSSKMRNTDSGTKEQSVVTYLMASIQSSHMLINKGNREIIQPFTCIHLTRKTSLKYYSRVKQKTWRLGKTNK